MWLNALAAIASILLLLSPFIGTWPSLNYALDLRYSANISGWYKLAVVISGAVALILSLYNLYIKKIRGLPFLFFGLALVSTAYFYNGESFAILPLKNTMLGGGLFLAFVTSIVLLIIGVVQEFLLTPD